ncbi:MAG: aminotransferase class I/II-fold pyridoxal phosphate-dependent enzyme [Magnetococcales bacterium]|nr:aminotransferase class I/II-fold pyridoxal phosphate-dependent enzyme [Magnetococcales bacterium]MBF0437875.1 aminotransferase class I/II-fold pyridoxal phosphate-dependent enzyme [Magnetococcales bacterium]
MNIRVRPNIHALTAYAPPWTGLDRTRYLRLDLNENTRALPPEIRPALERFWESGAASRYPEYLEFLPKLAAYVGVDENQLILTNGSDQGIEIVLRAFLDPGDGMVVAQPEFPIFSHAAKIIGAQVQGVPFNADLSFPSDSFLEAINANTRLVVLINPNNPTGSTVPMEIIQTVLARHPNLPILVDEAYFEFTGITCLELLRNHSNLIVIRTFSKAFAMAGLRLGYVIAHPEMIGELNKVRGPFDVNACAVAVASAQLDLLHLSQGYVREVMTQGKPFVENAFREHGVQFFPASANFMLVQPLDRDQAVAAMKEQGILVRPMVAPSLLKTFRLTLGPLEEMEKFITKFLLYTNKLKERVYP